MDKKEIKFWLEISKKASDYELQAHREQIALHQKFLSEAKECEKCKRKSLFSVDHIIPLKLLADFGFNINLFYDKEDLRILCQPCNYLKSDHLDFSTLKTKILLLKYLRNI